MGSIGRKRGGLWSGAFLTVCVGLAAASRGVAAEDDAEAAPFRVQVLYPATAQALKRALGAADQRLSEAACLEVLTDFRDASARPLKEALDANEVSARGYFRWIVFVQDQGSKACKSQGTVAVTEPGSRVVFITCGRSPGDLALAEAPLVVEVQIDLRRNGTGSSAFPQDAGCPVRGKQRPFESRPQPSLGQVRRAARGRRAAAAHLPQ